MGIANIHAIDDDIGCSICTKDAPGDHTGNENKRQYETEDFLSSFHNKTSFLIRIYINRQSNGTTWNFVCMGQMPLTVHLFGFY